MNWTLFFLVLSLLFLCGILLLAAALMRVKEQLGAIQEVLDDIEKGNLNRRILTRKSDMARTICYHVNEIVVKDQTQLVQLKRSEQSYKRLMTSLSHDVKTPLASLTGYLEAVYEKMVTGDEKETYISVALDKAQQLKNFVEALFEWVKLDAKEQIFQFEPVDLNELSRDVLTGWVPRLEEAQFTYEINIPDAEYSLRVDRNAYARILNNLLENVLFHSHGDRVSVRILEDERQATVIVADNGKGIPEKDLPYIFERLYRCDESRTSQGNGLGLSIVRELVTAHGGGIRVECPPHGGTAFSVILPKAR